MILQGNGSILDADQPVEAIVNPVNCVGVMGGGLARAFAKQFPLMENDYKAHCHNGTLRPGRMHVYAPNYVESYKFILNLPTKDHWRDPSKIEYVQKGLIALLSHVTLLRIKSVAIPALGCGLGGLDWDEVKPLIIHNVSLYDDVMWYIFDPQ